MPNDVYQRNLDAIAEDACEEGEEFVEAARRSWNNADPLFKFVSRTGDSRDRNDFGPRQFPAIKICGCLTQIKSGQDTAFSPWLTEVIRADPRIPESPEELTPADCQYLAGRQRWLDEMIPGRYESVAADYEP